MSQLLIRQLWDLPKSQQWVTVGVVGMLVPAQICRESVCLEMIYFYLRSTVMSRWFKIEAAVILNFSYCTVN